MNLCVSEVDTRFPLNDTLGIGQALEETLPNLVAKLDVDQVAVRWDRKRPILHPEDFGFIALRPLVYDGIAFDDKPKTLNSSGYVYQKDLPPDIRFWKDGGRAYLDTQQGIGLVFDNILLAVGGAGIDSDGEVKVTQLQDVTGVRKGEEGSDQNKEYRSTGLHQRLLWRHTLVRAWEQIGQEVGSPVIVVQSWKNNDNKSRVRDMERGMAGYDQVAQHLGFSQTPDTHDWIHMINPSFAQLVLSKS